ncbi:N-formylglutamate amidohydrolase [Niabella aquatica]
MNSHPFFTIDDKKTPVIAFALHDGHFIDGNLRRYLLLDEQGRAREEDPYTGYMIADLPVSKVVVHTSRFQLDLNRTKDKAVYLKPEDAWGLNVWNDLPLRVIRKLHKDYDWFYKSVAALIEAAIKKHGCFFILDVHSYNHLREHPFTEADVERHPEINMGTAYNSKSRKELCDRFTGFFAESRVLGHKIDARQNVIFKGGAFARWVIANYGSYGAVCSIEFKKTFMNEWTGIADIPYINRLKQLLELSVSFLYKEINNKNTEI